jgi:hypothetical protein
VVEAPPKKSGLTDEERFRCRVTALTGILPSAVRNIPAEDYDLLLAYWDEEPWGAWRDNLHAAIIAREVRRPWLKQGAADSLDGFMVVNPEVRRKNRLQGLVEALRAMAGKPKG